MAGAPSTWEFLAAGVVLLAAFAAWQARAAGPLLPPRVVLNRNRGGAYLAMLIVGAGMFGIFLFLTYYLQTTLGYWPVVTGLAFLLGENPLPQHSCAACLDECNLILELFRFRWLCDDP